MEHFVCRLTKHSNPVLIRHEFRNTLIGKNCRICFLSLAKLLQEKENYVTVRFLRVVAHRLSSVRVTSKVLGLPCFHSL